MHPAIAQFPSIAFYDGELLSGTPPSARRAPMGFDWPVPAVPLAFVDVADGYEVGSTAITLSALHPAGFKSRHIILATSFTVCNASFIELSQLPQRSYCIHRSYHSHHSHHSHHSY
jgi:hypothetical protein